MSTAKNEYSFFWDKAKDLIKTEIPALISYTTWINPLEFIKFEENIVYLKSQNTVQKNMITKNYVALIENAYSQIVQLPCSVKIVTEEDISVPADKTNTVTMLNPNYTFDTFVIGNSNRFAHAACLAVAEAPGEAYNPLFLYGGVGLGKTHLMQSIGHFVRNQKNDKKVVYVSSENFINEFIKSIQLNKMEEFREFYRKNVDVLLIDDIQFIANKERTQEEFFHTFNDLYESQKQIIISSDKPPQDIEFLEERLRSRFEWGLIADVQPPDLETRIAILSKKAQSKGYNDIDYQILEYIATKAVRNIRKLEGALLKVIAFSEFSKSPITPDLVKESLKDYLKENSAQKITPHSIIETVCERFSLSKEQMCSRNRQRDISYPRQIAMYLLREMTDLPLADIGKLLGNRDHTTVIYACKVISITSAQNNELRLMLADLSKKVRGT